jgi:tetratricopeptide (TPR) repeat protein
MRLGLAAILMLTLAAAGAHADQTAAAQARALYDKAIAHYDLAEYDVAIGEFKQAYELSRQPGLLFNIAQSYRLKKDYEQALHFYRTYLELVPDAPNRRDAEAQIRKMNEALKAAPPPSANVPAPAPAPPVATGPATPLPPPAVAAPPPAPPPSFVHTRRGQATMAIAAVGAAAAIAAAGTGGEALAIRSRYDASCTAGSCDGGLYSRGRGFAIATDVLIGVGVVAAVTATLVGLVHRRERPLTVGMRF